jgi:hydroxyquinol 1,2-dioxygenase
VSGDVYLDSDVVFCVKDALIEPLVPLAPGLSPAGHRVDVPGALLAYDFVLPPQN